MNTVRTRNVDPELARLRAMLGPLERDGRAVEAAQVRRELAEAKLLIAARNVAAQIADMVAQNPDVAEKARAILVGAA